MRRSAVTSAAETRAQTNGWRQFPVKTFVEEGLLAYVNESVLWPLGLALTVVADRIGTGDRDFDWDNATLTITEAHPAEPIVSGRDDFEALMDRCQAWIEQREEEMGG